MGWRSDGFYKRGNSNNYLSDFRNGRYATALNGCFFNTIIDFRRTTRRALQK